MSRSTTPARRARLDPRLVDAVVLVGLLVLAAALRLPDLASRGTFDGDQGFDANVVRSMLRDGVLPLLGPSTSTGDFHHGAAYYYLLAPAGIPSGGDDPIALALLIAVLGTAAVGITWWLGRSIAGSFAGLVAGGLLAVSAGAVDGSTFIWNPNPIPFFAALALAAAWRAASRPSPSWWLVAGAAQGMVQQLHVLGVVGLVPIVALWAWTWHRSPRDRRPLVIAGVGAIGLIALFYAPLVVHELQTGFDETRAAIAWLTGGGANGDGPGLVTRLAFVPLRIVAWPLVGPIVDAVAFAVLAVAAWGAAVAVAVIRARGRERTGLAWLGGSVIAGALLLAVGVRSLAVVTPLPNDHYHAFLWPAIAASAGVASAVLARPAASALSAASARGATRWAGTIAVTAILVGAVAWNLAIQPPRVAPDGGWPAAEAAGQRVADVTDGAPTAVVGTPAAKKTAALDYPLTVLGQTPVAAAEATHVAVLCDALFEEVIGLACRGPAESARLAELGIGEGPRLDLFEAAPGRWISVYEVAGR